MTKRIVWPLVMLGLAYSLPGSADELYYQIGGANPFGASASAGLTQLPPGLNMGVRWNVNATCGNFDMGYSVSNALNGVTNTFQSLMGNVIQNAQGAVASLPAMIIQRSYPQLYELLSNGVLQGRLDYDRSKLSCQAMANKMGDWIMGERLQQSAVAEAWSSAAATTRDPNEAQAQVEAVRGDDGVTWVAGQRRGGRGQPAIQVINDVTVAGYNLLHGRADPLEAAPVRGGGGGWGSVPTTSGSWPGGGGQPGAGSPPPGDCRGGMCTVWASPRAASEWVRKVLGESTLQTCDGCQIGQGQAGTGLMKDLEAEQEEVHSLLEQLVGGSVEPSPANLRKVSGGEGLAVSRSVIEALRSDPDSELLVQRLSTEMAMSRVLIKAMWAWRLLLAGMSEPGIAQQTASEDAPIAPALNPKVAALEREINALKTELEVRTALAGNTSTVVLHRAAGRSAMASETETFVPGSTMDSRGRPKPGTGAP